MCCHAGGFTPRLVSEISEPDSTDPPSTLPDHSCVVKVNKAVKITFTLGHANVISRLKTALRSRGRQSSCFTVGLVVFLFSFAFALAEEFHPVQRLAWMICRYDRIWTMWLLSAVLLWDWKKQQLQPPLVLPVFSPGSSAAAAPFRLYLLSVASHLVPVIFSCTRRRCFPGTFSPLARRYCLA